MRLSTTLLPGLAILGFCTGCTMFGNPLASRTDPAEAARERQAAEVSALIARGDYEGAQRLIDAAQREADPAAAPALSQTGTQRSEADREKMIDQLLASQPAEWREMLRQKYSALGTNRLEELVARDNELRGIGQGVVPEPSIPGRVQEPSIQLAGSQQRPGQAPEVTQAQNRQPGPSQRSSSDVDGFGIGFPQRERGGELHAPDPRPQGTGHATQPETAPGSAAPRLPDGLGSSVSQAGHRSDSPAGAIQPVSGTHSHSAAYAGALGDASGTAGPSGPDGHPAGSHPFAPRSGTATDQLPRIIPGNSQLRNGSIRSTSAPGNPFAAGLAGGQGTVSPMAGQISRSPAGQGGVALENRIEIDSGTISGSATTQLGGAPAAPFPTFGQPSGTGQAGAQNSVSHAPYPQGSDFSNGSGVQSGPAPPAGAIVPGSQAAGSQAAGATSGERSLIPGVIRGGYESIQNLTTNVTERGLRGFGSSGNEAASGTLSGDTVSSRRATVDDLIAGIESELARSAPGDTEIERLNHVRKQVNLRMLYLIADRIDQSIEPISAADPADQEFWQQLFFAYVNYFDAQQMPHASDRATQTIDQLRAAIAKLRHRADLKLKNVTFCHHIVSFGDYERFSADQFTPGQPLLLYAEVENFFSTRTDTDRYRTVLQSQIEIYDNSNMQRPVVTIPFDPSEDICRNHRRDFFHSYEFTVPQELRPGLYTLVLRVTDQLSQKVATSRLNFRVE